MTEVWTKWESQVISGVFPLRRFLGRSNHSVVFLTEYKAHSLANAAIKIIPADPALAEAQLWHWRTVATLSHPHLIRILDSGHCQLGGHQFLFVVMEYAEETLAEILPQRALTPEEVREMLPPILDALAFVHGKNLVLGQLKPPNVLVVNDQVKLASDAIRPAGASTASNAKPSPYDPPEAKNGRIYAAGDIWGLGMTIVEALTQRPPGLPDPQSETASLPAHLPAEFDGLARRCLSRNPANRPAIAELDALIKRTPQASGVSVPQPVLRDTPRRTPGRATTGIEKALKARSLIPAIAVGLVALAVVGAGLRLFRGHRDSRQPAASAPQAPPQQAAIPATTPPQPHPQTSSSTPQTVVHQEIPDVPRSARESIHGHIQVTVRVTVDRSGNVIGESLQSPGSSRYFARLAGAAARKWRFAPADNQDSRAWLLRFDFSRGSTTAHAAPARS
jgi:TonB family protein